MRPLLAMGEAGPAYSVTACDGPRFARISRVPRGCQKCRRLQKGRAFRLALGGGCVRFCDSYRRPQKGAGGGKKEEKSVKSAVAFAAFNLCVLCAFLRLIKSARCGCRRFFEPGGGIRERLPWRARGGSAYRTRRRRRRGWSRRVRS